MIETRGQFHRRLSCGFSISQVNNFSQLSFCNDISALSCNMVQLHLFRKKIPAVFISSLKLLLYAEFIKGWNLCQLEVLECKKVPWPDAITEETYSVEDCGWPSKDYAYECKINLLTGRTHQVIYPSIPCGKFMLFFFFVTNCSEYCVCKSRFFIIQF